ncbi:hypothetical protein K1T71_012711 [Dendrolimus kikuchii]|uniref:Uncharacterized protein n=1 Tax=Dendrolimus kikuchii TaxID=765133 RepID=A0ACC1CK32_9NEOP|nr:hypothetical protein K1T71_012711 [Dendrolimus kikuchii]
MSSKDKWVRRFTVDETAKHKNGFTIYKITSVLFPIESPEAVTAVSVWKRYSDVQRLHKSMRSLHAGLHLRGTFPALPKYSYFRRFSQDVISERAQTIKALLEFVAEHRLLFTSTDFVNFLQTGYPEPEARSGGVIEAIRSSLHLPIEETPPLEYQTDDDDARSPSHQAQPDIMQANRDETDFISQIPIYEAADVEIRQSPIDKPKITTADSYESINSLDSIDSDLYDELSKVTIDKSKPTIKNNVLPDLINFDVPSTSKLNSSFENSSKFENTSAFGSSSKFENYEPKTKETDTLSLNSNLCSSSSMYDFESRRSSSRLSLCSKQSVLSLSNVECKTRTEDSYVFEAGYMLNLAAKCENMGDYQRAFDCYKSGIEKMLIGVQTDSDAQRRALIKEKTNKYLSYAEAIYKNHLCDSERSLLPERDESMSRSVHCPIPLSMLKRSYDELSLYRVLAILGSSIMLVLHQAEQNCYAMKVIRKVPKNLTEFDEYFLQRTNETRTPILPTVIPYMVPLHAYIETTNLIFLILAYAPGEKLFSYIKNYAKSKPNTPAREVNLENVFTEPKTKNIDIENDNIDRVNPTVSIQSSPIDVAQSQRKISVQIENETKNNNMDARNNENNDLTVTELVMNSQKLLLNVDRALSNGDKTDKKIDSDIDGVRVLDNEMNRACEVTVRNVTPTYTLPLQPRDVLPPSAVCKWGAEILTAIESLHNSGVICRDLNPSNILLGDRGQVILTYFMHYPGEDMRLDRLRRAPQPDLFVAPELYGVGAVEGEAACGEGVCDFWSYGAVMYELLCGVPLSYYHRSTFTSHTILQMPDGLPMEVQSLLTQLLTYEPSERLGSGKDGIEEIKRHPYFKSIDWQYIYDSWIVPD